MNNNMIMNCILMWLFAEQLTSFHRYDVRIISKTPTVLINTLDDTFWQTIVVVTYDKRYFNSL